ncbi:MAG TPA: 1,2-phenylacetyl-CoA epoxidase subunit PaaE [Solirubrobacterales bacterium]|nr:1,2-phenylacetyl-CoA epoxidase subunit PaaE [Solirubrobacterales bacterium]
MFHPLRVSEVERLTDDSVAVTLAIPAELREAFRHTPGQHVAVRRTGANGEEIRRTYSICAPAGSGQVRIAVKRLPGGAFSTWANEGLRPGEKLAVSPPVGTFTLPLGPGRSRRLVAISAGSGITPVVSLAATVLEREPESQFALIYGNRTSATTMFLEELQDLKDRYPERFELFSVFSREPQAVELFSGRLDRERLERLLDAFFPVDEVDQWLLCGPLGLIENARGLLVARGVDPDRVHREIFFAAAPTVAAAVAESDAGEDVASVRIRLDGREATLPVARGGAPILDTVLRSRADAPYACRGGVCGTCRARVLEGEVRMDAQYALEPGEVERGYVLACQAHPVSKRVFLDFDQ